MDPLTAVGLASRILSFITFSAEVVSGAIKIHESLDGTLDGDRSQAAVARELQALAAWVSPPSGFDMPDEKSDLSILARECNVLSQQLIDLLDKAKPKRPQVDKSEPMACAQEHSI